MNRLEDVFSRIAEFIDEEELVNLSIEMGNLYAPPGEEKLMSDYVADWFAENDIPYFRQKLTDGRENVIGYLGGAGTGQSLLLNAHMDSGRGGPLGDWSEGKREVAKRRAWRDGDKLFGQALLNDRACLAATMVAAKAIKRAGIELGGNLFVTGVVGEIGMAPVDEFQGERYRGKGYGSKALVDGGVIADYALVAETTNFAPVWAEAGCGYYKITLFGESVYTPRSHRPENVLEHPNAIVKAAELIRSLEQWAVAYEQENVYEYGAGTMVPKVNIGAIRGGSPYAPSRTAPVCSVYVDVRIPPTRSPIDILSELQAVVRRTGLRATVECYLARKGYEARNIQPLLSAVKTAHERVCEFPIAEKAISEVTSMWRDINVFNEFGIPSLTYGPSRRLVDPNDPRKGKYMAKQDLVDITRIYTWVILLITNLSIPTNRSELQQLNDGSA